MLKFKPKNHGTHSSNASHAKYLEIIVPFLIVRISISVGCGNVDDFVQRMSGLLQVF